MKCNMSAGNFVIYIKHSKAVSEAPARFMCSKQVKHNTSSHALGIKILLKIETVIRYCGRNMQKFIRIGQSGDSLSLHQMLPIVLAIESRIGSTLSAHCPISL